MKQTVPQQRFARQARIQGWAGNLLALELHVFVTLTQRYRWLLLPVALLMLSAGRVVAAPPMPDTRQADKGTSAPEAAEADGDLKTTKLLAAILEANRYWFDGTPPGVPSYRYAFVHRDGKRQEFRIADPQTAGASIKRGITYTPLVAVLLQSLADSTSNAATMEVVEYSNDQIQIRFHSDGSLGARLGGGVSGRWAGYLYYKLGSGVLRLDAKTLMPIELTSTFRDDERDKETIVTEKLSEPHQIDADHVVPLHVEAIRQERESKNGHLKEDTTSRFDWAFRVYEPGLWLFDAEPTAAGTAIGYHLENVVIDYSEEPVLQASSSVVASIRELNKQTSAVVDQYVEANRAWLLPDLQQRTGLIYDYTQEEGYRERVIFDSAGNVLVQLARDRQSDKTPLTGKLNMLTADGREANGMADEPFVAVRSFSDRNTLDKLATGWGWQCASKRLAHRADNFGVSVQDMTDQKTRKLTLRPVRNRPTLDIGTMLRFISWAYLPGKSFERCEIEINGESQLPTEENYFVDGNAKPFCTIRFEDWLETPEGRAPGKIVGRATYPSRGKRDPVTREYEMLSEDFYFTAKFRLTEGGLWLLDEVVSTFESTGSGSTGRVTLVEAGDEDYQPLRDVRKRLDATSDFLGNVEKAACGLERIVPCRWGETTPVWLNGKYAHQATGQGDEGREPPYVVYRKNLGIQNLHPEVLPADKIRVTVNAYSTLYFTGYSFDVTLRLLDNEGLTLAEQTAVKSTKTMAYPEQKPIVFEFDSEVDPANVASIAVALRINRQSGGMVGSFWGSFGSSTADTEIAYLPGGRDWGPEQAIGEPANRGIGGDYKHAWSPLTQDDQAEWLEISYQNRVQAIGVNVYETCNPGAVHKVTYYDAAGNEQTAWEGDDPTSIDVGTGQGVSKIRFEDVVATDRVRIYLDSVNVKGWNEIDAVGLIEAETSIQWAEKATASSTYAH
ncbi:hypothetical protein Q31b_13900 [Novipirellula aureliae]|uniref:Uncharacterized protein n=1 Tax=Novipirellula aureliae TaxID=2527966 RepID=A0A5C6E4L8_9BACT|nr:hypothetical protein [Novipirellula aureliae]TWU43858.1 hypothetical protein Q31b_13900 [Novipirellula aureliae]